MPGFSSLSHWLLLLLIVVLVFGTKKLRNVGKDLGGAVHDFKKGLSEGTDGEGKGQAAAKDAVGTDNDKPA